MPKRTMNYRGFDVHVDLTLKRYCYQVWVRESCVIAAASLAELFHCVDAHLLRVEQAA